MILLRLGSVYYSAVIIKNSKQWVGTASLNEILPPPTFMAKQLEKDGFKKKKKKSEEGIGCP